jgi:hypothetical protein
VLPAFFDNILAKNCVNMRTVPAEVGFHHCTCQQHACSHGMD